MNKEFTKLLGTFSSDDERSILLRASLASISGVLTNVAGVYDGRVVFPNLYLGVIAPPASGKGVIGYARALIDAVNDHYLDLSSTDYHTKAAAEAMNRVFGLEALPFPRDALYERPVPLVAVDITKSMLLQQLSANYAAPTVLIHDEIDALVAVMGSEHGKGLSAVLRAGFHNETLTQQLKTKFELLIIKEPKIAVALAGTPDQMKMLIGNLENGLYSRFLLYFTTENTGWRDISASSTNGVERRESIAALQKTVLALHRHQLMYPLEVSLTANQWSELNKFGQTATAMVAIANGEELMALVKRHALMVFKICLVLTALRRYDQRLNVKQLEVDERDFEFATKLVASSLKASVDFAQLKLVVTKKLTPFQRFYVELPTKFDRKQALEIGEKLGMSTRTTDRALKFLKDTDCLGKEENNTYYKIKVND